MNKILTLGLTFLLLSSFQISSATLNYGGGGYGQAEMESSKYESGKSPTDIDDYPPLTITHMIGDNDGYGYGANVITDGADLPYSYNPVPGYGWLFDNRSDAEKGATKGSQWTDMEDLFSASFHHQFDLSQFNTLTEALFTIDISGLEQGGSAFGGYSRLFLDGIEVLDFMNINQGAWGSGLFTFEVDLAMLADGALDVYFENESNDYGDDHLAIDFTQLAVTGNTNPIPEPGTMVLLGMGIAGIGFYRRFY